MTVYTTHKLSAFVGLAATGFVASLILRRPEPVLMATPFLVALVFGLALARVPDIHVGASLSREHAVEGDDVTITIVARSAAPVARLDLLLRLPDGVIVEDGEPVCSLALPAGTNRRLQRMIRCRRWGGYAVGDIYVRARDPFGFLLFEAYFNQRQPLRVFPRPLAIRSIVRAAETQVFAGNELARTKGDGIEFIDVRPFAPGDRVRRVNWRLSTQRQELYVNEFHREQNSDVIFFLDAFAEVRRAGEGTLDHAVRGIAALAERYLERRDRVGLVSFGGLLRWLRPDMGMQQRYRIIESLIDTEVVMSYAWKEIDVIPASTLPPKALILAFTPLLDDRSLNALLDLRARRFDLAIIEVSPISFVQPSTAVTAKIAFQIWELERETSRNRFRQLGVPVVGWYADRPLEEVIQEVQSFRRYTHRVRA